ncbi:MAG: sigma-70 family RNA polymerase sigma factor [Clostridia bacterium]|nr:sigma-70 family RNA polymerase sigma factor [Clostridia bacterium]
MEDAKIIELFFSRSEEAITETASKYGKLCFSISGNILGNNEDSEECVNDTYLALWNCIPPQKPSNLMAFISKIVRNLSLKKLDYNLAKKRDSSVTHSLSELEEILPDKAISNKFSDDEIGRILSNFLKNEKADSRNVFIRKYWYFDSVEDISKRYKFSESKVKSMLFHTRNRLKKYLIKEGVRI